ncbi:MAG: hypothetical protein ACM65L_15675 [Microcoleus sp.]
MKDANKRIFEVLDKFVQKSQVNVPVYNQNIRCIKTKEEDKEWLKELKIIKEQPILPNFKTALFKFKNQKYFVAVGWQIQKVIDNTVIELVELNAGIVTALLFELKISLNQKASPYDIAEIFYESEEEIIPYDFSVIANFYEPFSVYQIQEDSPFFEKDDQDLIRLSGFYALKNSQLIALNFYQETREQFEKIFFEGSTNIPYENLLLSLVSVSWKYSFLEIYRCIERLFSISFLESFHKSLSIPDSLRKFSYDLETIGWKPKENEAINKLIDDSPEEASELLREIKKIIDGTEEGKCGDLIYKIRNSIVHFRLETPSITLHDKLDDKHWDMLIRASLYIVEHWYNHYHEHLRM